jgi:peptidoglycan/xylan/chitin deacetylase (PgdA/CDA1 family)
MRKTVIHLVYTVSRALGLFRLARRVTRSGLRILCYHGFVIDDEDRFRGSLFLSQPVFEERMRYLRDEGYPVLEFDEAMRRLDDGTLPPNAVTITIDDGFYSVHGVALDVLRRHRLPALLYVTSYYFEKGTPIFQLVLAYLFWKSPRYEVDLSGLGISGFDQRTTVPLDERTRDDLPHEIFSIVDPELDGPGRVDLSRRLAERLAVDYAKIESSRILSLVRPEEMRELERSGVKIALHTHRHRLPNDLDRGRREIEENRRSLEPVVGRPLTHFCYPSGKWSEQHWPILQATQVQTATTCDSGLTYAATPRLALPRFLDDNRVSFIEFEAELTGFSELLRWVRGKRPAMADRRGGPES